MAQINVDPEKLINFADDLRAFNDFLENNTSMNKYKFKRLCESWDDHNQRKFAAEYDRLMLNFRKENEKIKELESYLRRLAEKKVQHY